MPVATHAMNVRRDCMDDAVLRMSFGTTTIIPMRRTGVAGGLLCARQVC
jgi:hypothetical protein